MAIMGKRKYRYLMGLILICVFLGVSACSKKEEIPTTERKVVTEIVTPTTGASTPTPAVEIASPTIIVAEPELLEEPTIAVTEAEPTIIVKEVESTKVASTPMPVTPTKALAKEPTKAPIKVPTDAPTKTPSKAPTKAPTKTPTKAPEPTKAVIADNEGDHESQSGFYVEGTKLYDVKGNEFIMRGINHAHTWYKGQRDTALKAIAATGANTVRIVLSDGQQWTKDDTKSVKEMIALCKELKMIAVLEVHDITGKNTIEGLNKTVDYWISIKDALIGNEAYVIINIANEWYGDWKSRTWADGYIAAIPKLRDAGLTHTIMVDSAGWGQYPKSIVDYGNEVFNADPLENTMFSIHMYEYAGGNAKTIKSNIDGVTNKDLCVIIGEFGYKHSSGDVDEKYILSYCEEIGLGYIGWSWKGNGGGVEYLDIAVSWDGSELSSDWGETLINGKNGIRKTSEICTVFD